MGGREQFRRVNVNILAKFALSIVVLGKCCEADVMYVDERDKHVLNMCFILDVQGFAEQLNSES